LMARRLGRDRAEIVEMMYGPALEPPDSGAA